MNIYILLEIQKRELYSKILLSLEAASKGHIVYLGKVTPFLMSNIFNPGIVHFKSITPGPSRLSEMKYLKDKNFLMTSLDEEHGIINNNADYIKYRYSNTTINYADYIFTYGKFDYNNLSKIYQKYKKKFIKSGNPRIDFWKKNFKNFFFKYNDQNFKDYILLSANFEGFGHKTIQQTIKFHKSTGYFERGASQSEMISRFKNSKKLFSKYEKTIKKMSQIFKDKEIIIRPHPKDDLQKWKKIFKAYRNIHVINIGNHSDWIYNAKVVIHAGCTGGLEASLRGINTISYYPIRLNHGHKFADRFSKKINDEKKLFKEINNIYHKAKTKINIKNSLINERIYNYNGEDSYKIIVKKWTILSKKLDFKKNNYFYLSFLFFLLKIKLIFFNIKTDNYKFKKFDSNEIKKIIIRFVRLKSKFKLIKINYLGDNIIRFEK